MTICKLQILDEVNIKVLNLAIETRRKIVNKLKYELPYARHMPAYKLGRWDGTKTYFGIGGSGYLAHLDVILPIIENDGYEIEVEDLRRPTSIQFTPVTASFWADQGKTWPAGHPNAGTPVMLRDYQYDVINQFLANPQSLQEIATGAGKTLTTATLSKLCEPYGRTMVVVPNKSLVVQTEADYINLGLDVGVYFGDRKELNKTHTICTWQSLNVLDKKSYDNPDVLTLAEFTEGVNAIIIDEVHQAKADVLTKLLTQNFKNCAIRWGLTGTVPKEPWEFQGILASIGPVINHVSAHDLQEKGVLASLQINILQTNEVLAFKGFQEEYSYLVTNPDRIDWMANQLHQISQTGNTLVLVNRIETGEMIKDRLVNTFKSLGQAVEVPFICGAVKLTDRQDEYDDIKTSNNKIILATYGVAAVGINIPRIFNLVLIEPGKSFVRVIQSIGRGIRKAQDKDYVDIWDITSACKYSKKHLTERKKYYKDAKYPFKITKVNL